MSETKTKSPWETMKKIRLPRKPAGEDNFEVAGVNGKIYHQPQSVSSLR